MTGTAEGAEVGPVPAGAGPLPRRRLGGGGFGARRAVVRWAVRLYRREWRQQALVLGLLTVTVGAAVFATVVAYGVTPSRDAEFGTADERVRLDVATPDAAPGALAASRGWFGTVDAIGARDVAVAGSADPVELRAQDPEGPYGAPMLHLTEGRHPRAADEVALTDGVAGLAGHAAVGDVVELGGAELTVVGRIENPVDLDDEFALAARLPDDGTVAGSSAERLTLLLRADDERMARFPDPPGTTVGLVETRGLTERGTAGVVALSIGTLALLLVSLVAAAGFVVVGQRRLRQLGMLAAVGATRRHLRLVTLANGLAVGVVAAAVGTVAALAAWLAVAPALEGPAGHRIDRASIPWGLVATGATLAVVCAGAAAWWPARSLARVPVVDALSARPAPPRSVRRSAVLAVVLLAAGLAGISAGVNPADVDDEGSLLIVPGVVLTVAAVLLVAPTAVRALGAAAGRAPVGVRLAWRDLARYQARSGAALAAASVGLGIAVTVVILAGTLRSQADEGNLSDRQLLVRVDGGDVDPHLYVPDVDPELLVQGEEALERFAATVGGATVVPLRTAVDPTPETGPAGEEVRPALVLGRPVGPDVTRDAGTIYLATPELLDHLGLDAGLASSRRPLLLTGEDGPVHVTGNIPRPDGPAEPAADARTTPTLATGGVPDDLVERLDLPPYSSLPHALLTPAALDAGGWTSAPGSWLVEAPQALTADQLDAARATAADAGLTVEARRQEDGLATLRTAATAAGVLLALGILAMTVGLVRTEAARDIRTLAAVGAPARTRRLVTASTAGGLALLAVALGTAAAYLAVGAGYWPDTGRLTSTAPVAHLAAVLIGLPALAATAGWTLGGREHTDLRRPAAD